MPDLVACLADPQMVTRREAAWALMRLGPDAKDAVPALEKALDDQEADVKNAARRALVERAARGG